jgi:hypothetical protein
LFVGSVFAAGIGMYFLGKNLTNKWGGLVGSIFYIGNFYRVINLYTRGSLGESIASAVFPFVVMFAHLYHVRKEKKYLFLSSIFLGILLIVHNVSALFFLPIVLVILFLHKSRIKNIQILFFGFGLSAFFIFPAFIEKNLINFVVRDASGVIFTPTWPVQIPFFQIGILPVLAVILSYVLYKVGTKPGSQNSISVVYKKTFLPLNLCLVWYVFMMSPQSGFLWNLPLLSSVDFPWRLLGPISFLTAYLSMILTLEKKLLVGGLILATATFIISFRTIKVSIDPKYTDEFFITNDATTTSADELMPKWVIDKAKNRYPSKIEFIQGDGRIHDLNYNSKKIKAIIENSLPASIMINTIYYPGWMFQLNGERVDPILDKNRGTMIMTLPPGTNTIQGSFSETPFRLFADLVSMVSAAGLIIFCIKKSHE